MIEFEHNGFQIFHWKACWKGYDGVNISRWNLEIEPFVAQWNVQMNENMCELRAIKDHMPPWGVAGKGRSYCQLVLRLQEGRDIDQP